MDTKKTIYNLLNMYLNSFNEKSFFNKKRASYAINDWLNIGTKNDFTGMIKFVRKAYHKKAIKRKEAQKFLTRIYLKRESGDFVFQNILKDREEGIFMTNFMNIFQVVTYAITKEYERGNYEKTRELIDIGRAKNFLDNDCTYENFVETGRFGNY